MLNTHGERATIHESCIVPWTAAPPLLVDFSGVMSTFSFVSYHPCVCNVCVVTTSLTPATSARDLTLHIMMHFSSDYGPFLHQVCQELLVGLWSVFAV